MKKNMASWDRAARVVIGLVLIALALAGSIGLWGWIGVVPLLTGLVGSCPLYSVVGIRTCKSCD